MGWHRHPHMHSMQHQKHNHHHQHHHQDQTPLETLGPLDEIVNDEDDGQPTTEHIYSSVRKKSSEATATSGNIDGGGSVMTGGGVSNNDKHRPRLTSAVLRSSRILRRHTTYYHAKQFDSLPPQGSTSLMSTSITSYNKPHVHSWHRHKKQHQVR